MYTSKARYYLTADGSRVVPEGDSDAAVLYVAAGFACDEAEAERLGLLALEQEVPAAEEADAQGDDQPEEDEAEEEGEEPSSKALHRALVEDKAVAPAPEPQPERRLPPQVAQRGRPAPAPVPRRGPSYRRR